MMFVIVISCYVLFLYFFVSFSFSMFQRVCGDILFDLKTLRER